jgi:hypothetical protein
MSRPDPNPSIEHEPHLQDREYQLDPSERSACPLGELSDSPAIDEVEHNVWDEPALEAALAGGPPPDQMTYARWLEQRIASTSYAKSLAIMALLVACAGPWAVFGALLGGGGGGADFSTAGIVMIAVIGPVTEEIMKIALALWVVEQRPYLFKSIWQILVCATAGGLLFGVIENLIYLNVYIPDASTKLAAWRWTVCTGLHMNCSFVAGVGLARIWDAAIRTRKRPFLGHGMGWFATAMIGHGLYNLGVTVAQYAGWLEL